jgi:hypothetical protein
MIPASRFVAATALAVVLGAASCASNNTAGPQAPAGGQLTRAPASGEPTRSSSRAESRPAQSEAPKPPAGAQFTIYCATVPGAGHIQQSTQFRDQLVRSTGMRDWYVVHKQDESTLYYGYYRSIERDEDPKEAARARRDREKIDAMVDASGGRPFKNALVVQLAAPDPDAPPQWDLRNAPPGDYWSLQIAAYEGHPDRKKYAVDAVKGFRASNIPAYYYHGPTVSSVCLGTWPKHAVRGDLEPAYNDPNEKRSLEQIASRAPADELIVLSPGLPAVNKEFQTSHGRVRTVAPKLDVVDPTLLATMKAYPHHYLNGEVEGVRTKNGLEGKPSFLVQIPRRADSLFGGGGASVAGDAREPTRDPGSLSGAGAPAPAPAAARQEPAPGETRLRSLNDR